MKTYNEALEYASKLELGGFADWRVPTIEELCSLIDRTQFNPTLPKGHPFIDFAPHYWSSTTYEYNPYVAWYVYFYYGYVGSYYKSDVSYVRCVRSGQFDEYGELVKTPVHPKKRFFDNCNKTIIDNYTGLMWEQ